MMKTLHGRLLFSYALVILICLAVVGAAMWLFVLRNSLPDRQLYQELTTKSRLVLLRPVREELLDQAPSAAADPALQRVADALQVRVLLAEPDGTVIADTGVDLVGHNLLQEITVLEQDASSFRGSYRLPGTLRRWLFVGRSLPLASESGRWFVVAQAAARLPLLQTLGENLATPLVQAGVLGFVVAVLLALLISRSVARPIRTIAAGAEAMAAGNFEAIEPDGPVEVRQLAESFNRMALQVQDSQQAQRDLIANVSHDLKTPLTSIQGFSQAILDGTAGEPEKARQAAGIIHEEAGRMRRMVDDLLLLARLDAGQFQLERRPVDLADLLQGVQDRFELRARDAQVDLHLQLPAGGLLAFTGDGDQLMQLFSNLVDNALKHAPAGGQVTLSAETAGEQITVAVSDNGPGIPADQLGRIFERFYQVDKSRSRAPNRQGTGLGLAICRELAQAHGGAIKVESVVGVGTRFSVILPTAAGAPTVIRRP